VTIDLQEGYEERIPRCVWPTPKPPWFLLADFEDLYLYEDQYKPKWYVGGRYSMEDWKEYTDLIKK